MILKFGDVEKIKDNSWYILEIRSERTAENVIRRIGKAMPSIFEDGGCCEVFVPVDERDLNLFTLQTSSYVFLRSDKKKELQKFKGVTGVVGLLCNGEKQKLDKAILVDNEYVQGLIREAEQRFRETASTVQEGSFVRVIDGLDKGFCGHVVAIDHDFALVRIELKTRQMFLETPLRNLKDMSHVHPNHRVFYYSDLVGEYLENEGEQAEMLLMQDLTFTPETTEIKTDEIEERKVKFGRQKTVTALTKKLLTRGERNPKVIIKEALKAIEAGEIKKPKSAFIFYSILKQAIMDTLFPNDPQIKTYKDIVKLHGESYRFSPKMIAELDQKGVLAKKAEAE